MANLNVGLFTYSLGRGGVSTFVLRQAEYFHSKGYDVEVVTTTHRGEWFHLAAEIGIPAHHIDCVGVLPEQHARRTARLICERRFDVVLLHHCKYAQAALDLLPPNLPVIAVVHNDAAHVYDVGLHNYKKVNAVVGVSAKVYGGLLARCPEASVIAIDNGVFRPPPPRAALDRTAGEPLKLIFVGCLNNAQKGVMLLPDIVDGCKRRMIPVRLLVLGDGPDKHALQKRMRQLNVDGDIEINTRVDFRSVYDYLTASDIFVLPSYFEGMPLALLEALACGCVPVVSRLPGITDAVVKNGETGWLASSGVPSTFVDGLAELLRIDATLTSFRRRCYDAISGTYLAETAFAKYECLITDVLGGTHQPLDLRSAAAGVSSSMFTIKDYLKILLKRP